MIKVKNIVKKYGENLILNDISMEIEKGQIVFLVGNSGTGKSTFFKTLTFLERIDSGEIFYEDKKIDREIAIKENIFGFVPQSYGLFKNLTVLENITIVLTNIKNYNEKEAKRIAINLLKEFSIEEKKDEYIKSLSGGQRQRLAIARAISISPKLLVLDEPTSALDGELVEGFSKMIKNLSKEGLSFLITTHDHKFIKFFKNEKFYELVNGKLVNKFLD